MKGQLHILKLVPKVGPLDAGSLFSNSARWFNFGRRIQHHPAIELILRNKQNGLCPVCLLGLEGNLTIHHVSYMNTCLYENTVKIPKPTKGRPQRTVDAPPCDTCERVDKCTSFLALVHSRCHITIHKMERDLQQT